MGVLTENTQRVVREQRLAFVATVSPDGTPNLSPKGSIRVWDGDHLMFADPARRIRCATFGRTRQSISTSSIRLCARAIDSKGRATILSEGPQFEQAMAVYRSEIEGADERTHAIVLIRVERVLSLTSPGYDIGASEDEMRARWERHWDALRAASRSGR